MRRHPPPDRFEAVDGCFRRVLPMFYDATDARRTSLEKPVRWRAGEEPDYICLGTRHLTGLGVNDLPMFYGATAARRTGRRRSDLRLRPSSCMACESGPYWAITWALAPRIPSCSAHSAAATASRAAASA